MQDLTEKTLATERKYTEKIISVDLLDIELPDGRKAKREEAMGRTEPQRMPSEATGEDQHPHNPDEVLSVAFPSAPR